MSPKKKLSGAQYKKLRKLREDNPNFKLKQTSISNLLFGKSSNSSVVITPLTQNNSILIDTICRTVTAIPISLQCCYLLESNRTRLGF
jgi:hypothetical protein